ncbi:hypothetical protein ACIBKY_04725 [Nonomuraea sp. NPDC050394]|uniref:hypothetical protein n=1 Tax=Nonomuraea sp. NPDC050394 TaxID=3364363 RepID=UPI0037B0E816
MTRSSSVAGSETDALRRVWIWTDSAVMIRADGIIRLQAGGDCTGIRGPTR